MKSLTLYYPASLPKEQSHQVNLTHDVNPAQTFSNLKSLNIRFLGKTGGQQFTSFAIENPQLESLKVHFFGCGYSSVSDPFSYFGNIRKLCLKLSETQTYLTNDFFKIFPTAPNVTLESLHLALDYNDIHFTDEGLTLFSESMKNMPRLTSLKLDLCRGEHEFSEQAMLLFCRNLNQLTKLRSLNLRFCSKKVVEISENVICELFKSIRACAMKKIKCSFKGCKVVQGQETEFSGFDRLIASLRKWNNVRVVKISFPAFLITKVQLNALAKILINSSKLECFHIDIVCKKAEDGIQTEMIRQRVFQKNKILQDERDEKLVLYIFDESKRCVT